MTDKFLNNSIAQEAASENTSPQRLTKLAESDMEVARLVVKNPNTPLELLLELGAEFPEELLANPIFAQRLQENSSFREEIPKKTLVNLLKQPSVPTVLLRESIHCEDKEVNLAVVTNSSTPSEVLEEWLENNIPESLLYELKCLNIQEALNKLREKIYRKEIFVSLGGSDFAHIIQAIQIHINFTHKPTEKWGKLTKSLIADTDFIEDIRSHIGHLSKIGLITEPVMEQLIGLTNNQRFYILLSRLSNALIEFSNQVLIRNNYKTIYMAIGMLYNTEDILEHILVFPDKNSDILKTIYRRVANEKLLLIQLLKAFYDDEGNPNNPAKIIENILNNQQENSFLRYLIAMNPNVSVEIWEEFLAEFESLPENLESSSRKWDKYQKYLEICLELADNPNTPVSVLELICDFVCNPILVREELIEKFGLEDSYSNKWEGYTDALRQKLTAQPQSGDDVLRRLANFTEDFDDETDFWEDWEDMADDIRCSLALNNNSSDNIFFKLANVAACLEDESLTRILVGNPKTNSQALAIAYNATGGDEGGFVQEQLIEHPNLPVEELEFLQNMESLWDDECMENWLLEDPNINTKLLEKIATVYTSLRVRAAIAQNPNVPIELLKNLIKDDEYEIYLAAAKNPNTPIEILQQLAQHNSSDIRIAVVQNPNTTLELLGILAKDNDTSIRAAVSINPKLSQNSDVPETSQNLIEDDNCEINLQAAKNPNTPIDVLQQQDKHNSSDIRIAVAQNPNTTIESMEILAKDNDPSIRAAVLINPKLPLYLFEQLYSEISELLNYLNEEDFETLVERFSKDKPEFNTFAFHYRDRVYTSQGILPSFRRFVLLLHPQIPISILEKHKHSLQWRERYAITQNPSTPTEILQQLAEDANCVVRTAAQKKIEQQT